MASTPLDPRQGTEFMDVGVVGRTKTFGTQFCKTKHFETKDETNTMSQRMRSDPY